MNLLFQVIIILRGLESKGEENQVEKIWFPDLGWKEGISG